MTTSARHLKTDESLSTEETVWSLVKSGDFDTALDILAREYGSAVFTRAYRIVDDYCAAEDALQETFLDAYRSLPSFRGESSFKSWLVTIATRRGLDVVRRRRREERKQVPGESFEMTREPVADSLSLVDMNRHVRALEECLRTLCPEIRAVILMRFQQEMTYEEMARVLGDQPATLQARVSRAIPVLRSCLKRKGILP
jgi:RNA polymerase sigma-70 factor, ECF subfamily